MLPAPVGIALQLGGEITGIDAAWLAPVLIGYGGGGGLALLSRRLLAREKSTLWTPATLMLFAATLLAAGFAADWGSWRASGLGPEQSGQGATV